MTLASDTAWQFPEAEVTDLTPSSRTNSFTQRRINLLFDRWASARTAPAKRFKPVKVPSRVLDVGGAIVLLVVAAPFLALLAVILKLDSPGPLFFKQRRMGFRGREFWCIKFRTMCVDSDAALQRHLNASDSARLEWARDHKLRNDPRITRFGALVRKLSLDEFPQLINIIRGDMSLVGPRPIVRAEIVRYGRYFEDYCLVRPGLTGLWQVSGRNDVTYRRRVSIDRYYVRNKTLAFDMLILLRTLPVVMGAKGSY